MKGKASRATKASGSARKTRPARDHTPPPHAASGDREHARLHALGVPHDHSHGQSHAKRRSRIRAARSRDFAPPAPELEPGAGQGNILFLDTFSGLAGDMSVAALLDLGVPFTVVERAVAALSLRGANIAVERVSVGSIGATRFSVSETGKQRERSYGEIDRMLEESKLGPPVKRLARAIFGKLAEAEAEVHRIPVERVHFHEVGATDAIVDIVGAAACFVHLDPDEVVCTPLPLGRGFVRCRHGVLPLPAPATVACLKGAPTVDAGIQAELVTPTGAAIVRTVTRRFAAWPSFTPERTGWGAGTAVFDDRPNALRVVLGRPESAEASGAASHVVIEANVDDMTGELSGHAIATLLKAGALDAWATPVTMKKGRPGLVLSVLGRSADARRLGELVLRETSSIGVRLVPVDRIERPRQVVNVSTRFGEIAVKVSSGPYGAPVLKPEFDACVAAAAAANVPVRVVIAAALAAYGR